MLVCGGRGYEDAVRVYAVLDDLGIDEIVEGGAEGADLIARGWAWRREVVCHTYPAQWKKHGRSAGPLRNAQMLKANPDLDLVVAFPGGPGTANMVTQARRAGIPVTVLK